MESKVLSCFHLPPADATIHGRGAKQRNMVLSLDQERKTQKRTGSNSNIKARGTFAAREQDEDQASPDLVAESITSYEKT